MKLGKALAMGVAEEQPQARGVGSDARESVGGGEAVGAGVLTVDEGVGAPAAQVEATAYQVEAPAVQEVPVAR